MTRLFAVLFALLAFAATLVRADPPFISGGDSAFVPGISAVQIGGDLYQPATLTLDGAGASTAAGASTVRAASNRGSRAARAGRKVLDDAAAQATTEQPQQNNGGTIIIQGEEYVKSDAPLDVQKDLKYAQAASLDEEGRPSSELAAEAAEAAAASASAPAEGEGEGGEGEGGAAAAAAAEHEGGVEAATGRAPAQRVGDRRVAGPAHHQNIRGGAGGSGGGELAGAQHGEGGELLPRKAFRAHSEEVQRAHGGGAASKHSPLASKQPPVVDVGMQNKQMDSRRAHAGVLQGRKGA